MVMAHKAGKKEETRKKMLDAAGRKFREYGYSGVGVDGLAKAANVTSGAFYAHFGSKNAAFDAVLEAGLDDVIAAIPEYQSEHGADWVKAFVDYYLGKPHRNNLECACAMATLTPEVVRSATKVHAAYEKKMTRIADLITKGLIGTADEDRRSRAWAMLGVLTGGLNMALAMKNIKLADEVAAAIKIAAIKAAGRARAVK
jgi:AcrR family transcriptional regulator